MPRERYLLDKDEESIHSNVITADTPKAKAQNWWYYNKKKLLFGIIGAAVVVSLVLSIVFKEHPDYTIAIMSSVYLDDSALTVVEEQLSDYGKDLNGDGKVLVSVVNYAVSSGEDQDSYDATAQQVAATKFAADMSTGESMIWFHDSVGYYCMTEQSELFTPVQTDKKLDDPLMIPWNDVKALGEIDFSSYQNDYLTPDNMKEIFSTLRVSFRKMEGSAIERSEKLKQYHADSLEFFNNLMSGTKVTDNGVSGTEVSENAKVVE